MHDAETKGHGIDVALAMLERRIENAKGAGCNDAGHKMIAEALGDFPGCFRYLTERVQALPEVISARIRSDVLALVQAHTSDAVKSAVANLVPSSPPAVEERAGFGGPFAAALATISRVPMAATICAVTGFLTFSVYVLAKGLKIL